MINFTRWWLISVNRIEVNAKNTVRFTLTNGVEIC